jgi:hypothetical protein
MSLQGLVSTSRVLLWSMVKVMWRGNQRDEVKVVKIDMQIEKMDQEWVRNWNKRDHVGCPATA